MYQLFTDTSANLPTAYCQKRNIHVIPLYYYLDGEEHTCRDTASFDDAAYYAAMKAGKTVTTSQITPGNFVEAFRPALANGDDIIYICMARRISGSYDSAAQAREQLLAEFPERRIALVNTKGAGFGEGIPVMVCADAPNAERISMRPCRLLSVASAIFIRFLPLTISCSLDVPDAAPISLLMLAARSTSNRCSKPVMTVLLSLSQRFAAVKKPSKRWHSIMKTTLCIPKRRPSASVMPVAWMMPRPSLPYSVTPSRRVISGSFHMNPSPAPISAPAPSPFSSSVNTIATPAKTTVRIKAKYPIAVQRLRWGIILERVVIITHENFSLLILLFGKTVRKDKLYHSKKVFCPFFC